VTASCFAGSVVVVVASSATSISMRARPTRQISSLLYLMLLMTPSCVEGIFATSLSVNTSQMSSYYESDRESSYLLDRLAFLDEPLFDGGLFGALAQVGQVYPH